MLLLLRLHPPRASHWRRSQRIGTFCPWYFEAMIKLRSLPSALALLALSLLLNLAWADCYLPNGTSITQLRGSPQWLPCNSSSPYSMCCRTNGTGTSDTCLPNGLCHNDVAPNLWRESCTDPTWQSPYCLQLCTSATAINTGNPNCTHPVNQMGKVCLDFDH